jgi:hypothetical protein
LNVFFFLQFQTLFFNSQFFPSIVYFSSWCLNVCLNKMVEWWMIAAVSLLRRLRPRSRSAPASGRRSGRWRTRPWSESASRILVFFFLAVFTFL